MEQTKKQRQDQKSKAKERERLLQEQKEHERKKKQIAEYKQKKLITEELLANADLDDVSYGQSSNEEDADKLMNEMIEQYKGIKKRPPAVV